MKKILIIDDSALMRNIISAIIEQEPEVCVAGTAENGCEGIQLLEDGNEYDLILLDINMPKLNGVGFLEYLNRSGYHIPVLIVSSIAGHSTAETVRALELGAYDFVKKPGGVNGATQSEFRSQLCEKIQCVFRLNQDVMDSRKKFPAHTGFLRRQRRAAEADTARSTVPAGEGKPAEKKKRRTAAPAAGQKKLIFIASSTGGPKALQSVIPLIPGDVGCPVVVVQHMPAGFTSSLAERLNEMSPCRVEEAEDGVLMENDIVYVAKGGYQLRLKYVEKRGHELVLSKEEPRNGLRPCADIFLESLQDSHFEEIFCAVLTGMGSDATNGLLQLKKSREVFTVGQSQRTCVVYGMPRAAAQAGVVDVVADLTDVADLLLKKAR